MEQIVLTTLHNVWLYVGSYATALATASSFYAVFFFFWTRTGGRDKQVDFATKKIYLFPVYWILRLSLLAIIVTKLLEVILVKHYYTILGGEVSYFGIATSKAGAFMFLLLTVLALNSVLMAKRLVNYNYAIPVAVTSYFFLFVGQTNNMVYANIANYQIMAGEELFIKISIYLVALVVIGVVFNFFAKKVRNTSH